jgi:GTP pyrophosphokinase
MDPEALYTRLAKTVAQELGDTDAALLRLAYEYARDAHAGQTRLSGDPVIVHPLGVAQTLAELRLDLPCILAGLLHDVPEDSNRTLGDIRREFGDEVVGIVEGVTKLGKLKYRGFERYVENLRRMIVAMASDIRVILVKFADRLDNLKTLAALPPEKRARIARETVAIYVPIASRLGMAEIKTRLEDGAFPHLDPEGYRWLTGVVGPYYAAAEDALGRLSRAVQQALFERGVEPIRIEARRKGLYSLYEKLQRPEYERDLKNIHDLVALRIITRTLADCYAAVGVVHSLWPPVPGRFRDYIAQPKPNGYQSIHTAVFGPTGHPVEFQIRDIAMHDAAEFGIAAHWHYEESGKPDAGSAADRTLDWVNELARWQAEVKDSRQFLETLRRDVFSDRIFCFTPAGDVIDLPEGGTAVDFAYAVHTDLGHHAAGARVNDRIVRLDQPLGSGDVVEILEDKNRRAPNADWLAFVKTQHARSAIRRATRPGDAEG